MHVYKFNDVFAHIEKTLYEYYGKNPAYNKTLFILGYNVLGSLAPIRRDCPGYKLIVYQLEQLSHGSPWVSDKARDILKSADDVWDYDEGNIAWMKENYGMTAKFKPLLYTESLKVIPTAVESECDIDVLFYGYLHERRARFLIQLQHVFSGKSKIFDLYGVWGKDLDEYIRRSKIIINMRSYSYGRQEQPRIYYPVINGRCVLSETSPINYFGDAIVEADYGDMLNETLRLLKTGEWLDIAYQASRKYKLHSEKYKDLLNT